MTPFTSLTNDERMQAIRTHSDLTREVRVIIDDLAAAGIQVTSRAALIGWFNRIGGKMQFAPGGRSAVQKAAAEKRKPKTAPRPKQTKPRPRKSKPLPPLSAKPSGSMPYLEATRNIHCAYPLWSEFPGPDVAEVCGARCAEGSPYCQYHVEKVTEKRSAR